MSPIGRAVEIMGGPAAAARKLGVTTQAVIFWVDGRRRLPAERCPIIEAATGGVITAEDLRPDVAWSVIRGHPAPALAEQERTA